jgi:hypothetical protein
MILPASCLKDGETAYLNDIEIDLLGLYEVMCKQAEGWNRKGEKITLWTKTKKKGLE